jgi:Fe-S cluster assembly scaffold protein SufB
MTRGIGRGDARKLIVEGFLESAIDRVRDEWMRKEFMERAMAAV